MPGPVATARAALVAVLEPVWPGRVYAWWPAQPRPAAGVYVGEHTSGFDTNDVGVEAWAATFRVRLVADGADQAATALLDDLADQAYRAVAGSADFYPDAIVWDPVDVDAVVVLPAYTFTVRAWLDFVGWCATDPPVAVTIPPAPIGASTP